MGETILDKIRTGKVDSGKFKAPKQAREVNTSLGLPEIKLRELPEIPTALSPYADWTGKKAGVDERGVDLEAGALDLDAREKSLGVLADYIKAAGSNIDKLERRATLTGDAADIEAYQTAFEPYKAALERLESEEQNYNRLTGIYNEELKNRQAQAAPKMPTTKAEAEAYRAQLQSEIEALKAEGRRKSDTASAHGRDSLFEEPRYEYIRANDIAAKEKELADMEAAWYQTAMSEARLSVPEELQQQIGKMASRELGLAEQRELLDAMQAAGYTKREAQEIVEYAQQMKDRAHQIKRSEEAVENARERSTFTNWLFGTGAGLASGVGLLDIAEQNIENTLRGENPYTGEKTPVNYNTGAQSAYLRGQDIAEGQELKMVDKFYDRYLPKMGDEEKAKAAAEEKAAARMNAFNLATSMGQSAAVAGLTAMGVPAAMLLLSGSAGTATAQEYHAKGYSDGAALGMGLMAAAAEYVTEKVSIDALFKMSDAKSVRAVVGNVLTQMLTEGSEEVSSSLITAVSDAFVSALEGKDSEFRQLYDYYRERSGSDKEAFGRAIWDWAKQLGADFLGGAISGGIFGTGGTAVMGTRTAAADARMGRAIQSAEQAETVQELFEGLTQSERWQQRIKATEVNAENARELGKTARKIGAVNVDRAVSERLRALGDHTAQGDIVTAITAEAHGERLTANERAALKRSRYGAQVAEELKTAMEGESTAANRWATEAMDAERSYFEKLTTRAQANKIVKDDGLKAEFEEKTGVTLEGPLGEQARTVMEESKRQLERKNYSRMANAILNNAERLENFETAFGPVEGGSKTEQAAFIARKLREADRAAQVGVAENATTTEEATIAKKETVAEESAETEDGYESYVRGLLREDSADAAAEILNNKEYRELAEKSVGMDYAEYRVQQLLEKGTPAAANEILQREEYRAAFERMTGETLPKGKNAARGTILDAAETFDANMMQRDGFDEARKTLEKENTLEFERDGANIKIGVQESRKGGYTAAAYVNNGRPIATAGETRREAVEEVIKAVKEELKHESNSDAGQGNRADGIGTGGEAGAVSVGEEGTVAGTGSEAGAGVGAAEAEDLRKVSPAELGIRNGGTKKTIELVDMATLEGEAKAAAERVRSEGLEPVAIRGQIAVGKGEANAYIQGTKIYFSVDAKDAAGKPISPEKLVKHEIFHEKVRTTHGLLQEGRKAVRQSMSAERFDKMKKAYLDAYSKIQDFTDWTAEEIAEYLEEEICADAIAGINYFSGSTELTEKLEKLTEQMSAAQVETEAQQDTTGPPEGKAATGAKRKGNEYGISIEDVKAIRSIGRKSVFSFSGEDTRKAENYSKFYQKTLHEKSPFFRAWFGDWREGDKNTSVTPVIISETKNSKFRGSAKNKDTGWEMRVSRDGWGNTQSHAGQAGRSNEALKNIKGLLENAILLDTEVHEHHDNNRPNETIAFDHKLYSLGVEDDGNVGLYKITVEDTFQSKSEPNDFRFHNLHYLASVEKIATIGGSSSLDNNREPYTTDKPIVTTVNTVADLVEVVKKFDSEYKNQAASKVVDAEGKPLVVYHGTNEDFSVFQSEDGSYWFSENEDYAESMMEERGGGTVMPVYLNMRNPYRAKLPPGKFSDPNYEAPIIRAAKEGGYDGVIIENDTSNELEAETFYVVFDPTQIKSATDNLGTYDRENPDIHYSVSVTADLDADTGNYGEIDSSIRVPGRVEKREATQIAVTEGYPSLLNDEGEAVTAIPGWTWVRANDRGNYGVVVGKDGDMLEVFFSNKEQNVGRYVKMLPRELTAVEAQYSDSAAADRPLAEPPAWLDNEEDLTDPMTDEEFNAMMQEADDRESGRIRLAEELVGEGEVNTAEEAPDKIREVKELLEEDADLRYADVDVNPEDYSFVKLIAPGKGGNYNKTAEQNMDDAAGGNKKLRKELQEKIVAPVRRAVDAYNKAVNRNLRELHDKMKELGIKKGSRENLAIVWYGEGIKQGKGSGLPPEATEEYDLSKLQAEFPQTWEKIVEAEKYFRARYDKLLQEQNAAREEIYPKVVERAKADILKYNTIADEIEARATKTVFKLQSVRQSIQSAEARLERATTENARERAVAQLERLRAQEAKLEAQDDRYRQRAARTRSVAVNIQRKIDSGEILKNKFIRPRKDYFHHGREMATGLEGLFNTLTASADIDSGLSAMSEFTKPKAKWQGHFQQRSDAIYNADAIGDMQKYIQAAEYVIHIDKATARLRKQIQVIAELTQKERNANRMLKWMADWTNQITGKTNPMDRFVTDKLMGRKALKVLKWINGRVKSNAIMMNPRSALAQFYNLPVAAMHVKNPADWRAGAGMLIDAWSGEGSARHVMSQSGFLTGRYEIDKAEENLDGSKLKDIKKFSAWMMRAGDEAVAKLTWCAAYEQGLRENVADPIAHADDITRRSVAGRGIGEVPITQDSEITKLFAPFQVEVNNLWQVMKGKVKEKDLGALALFALLSWAMNAGARELFGSDVSYDPINSAIEAVESFEEDDTAWDKLWKIVGRTSGELISNMPYGAPVAQYLIPEDSTREKLFGDSDPTRFGTGNIGLNMLTAPLLALINGDEVTEDLVSAILNVGLPSGGKEAVRILDTLQLYGIVPEVSYSTDEGWSVRQQRGGGASYTDSGALRFATEATFGNLVQSLLFGEFATKEGKEYLESGGSPRGENTTALFQKLTDEGVGTLEAMEAIEALSGIKADKKNGKAVTGSRNVKSLEWLAASGMSWEAQAELYKGLIASDTQLEKIEAMENAGMGWGYISDTLMEYYETGFNGDLTANEKATSFAAWAMDNLSAEQAQLVRDEFTYSSGFAAKTDKYDALVEAGLEPNAASGLVMSLNMLTPEPGKASVTDTQRLYLISAQKLDDAQKYGAAGTYMDTDPGESKFSQFEKMEIAREAGMAYLSWVDMRSAEGYLDKAKTVVDSGIGEDEQLDVMETFLNDSQFFKLETATGYGVTPKMWTDFKRKLPEFDADGNENYKQAEVKACIDSIPGISDEERAILWQMETGGKNNPYDRAIGTEFKGFYEKWNEAQKEAKKKAKQK